jgi:outer membrane protein assembly factor BamD
MGFGGEGARVHRSVVPPANVLYETGIGYLESQEFVKARLAFKTLISTYPDSEWTASAYLALADSFYDEGGSQNLVHAEDYYRDFVVFWPEHPQAADAQMKAILSDVEIMRAYALKAEGEIQKMIDRYPDSHHIPVSMQLLNGIQEARAAIERHGIQ